MIDSCWLRLTPKFERLFHIFRRNESKRGKAADIGANFVVGLVLRLQSDLVHFANDTLTQLQCGPMPNVMPALPNMGGASVQRRKVWLTPTTRVPCSNAAL